MTESADLLEAWRLQWPVALGIWSRYTKLREPVWCDRPARAAQEGVTASDSGAMIRLTDQTVVISFPNLMKAGLHAFPLEILAHEIGHHVYCPGDLADQGRLLARVRRSLPRFEAHAGLVANLYADLLINNRLQRGSGLDLAGLFRTIQGVAGTDPVWTLYMHICEILWGLPARTLAKGDLTARLRADADLGARLARVYSRDWLQGAGKFAALLYPHIVEASADAANSWLRGMRDLEKAGAGADSPPDGLAEVEAGEVAGAVHPALDEELSGIAGSEHEGAELSGTPPPGTGKEGAAAGQFREPYQYGELLRNLGVRISDAEMAIAYYRERARPYLARFPRRRAPETREKQLEGLELWDVGAPLEELDLFESAAASPRMIPGVTTVRRQISDVAGGEPEMTPVDLDLYVDCSGSMPDPRHTTSYTALAGAIMIISALRAGSKVKATLWSGKNELLTTGGFVRDEKALLGILTGYLGGGTCFPIHLLRETYLNRTQKDRPAHVMVISDDGVDTMFSDDEHGVSGWETARVALENGAGGGTLALNLPGPPAQYSWFGKAQEQGWNIVVIRTLEELVGFARDFSRRQFERRSA